MSDTIPCTETKSWFHWGPHIPIAILLGLLLITDGVQTYNILYKNIQLRRVEARFLQSDNFRQLTVAEGIADRLDDLVGGLQALAPSNANARRILQDFNLPSSADKSAIR